MAAEIMAAEIMADEMIIPNELQTRDLPDLAHLLHLVNGLEAVGLDIDTAASRLYQIDEFIDRVRVRALPTVPVVCGTMA